MSDYVIMSDTGCDIEFETLREWGVGFRGLSFHFEGDREYQEGEMPKLLADGIIDITVVGAEHRGERVTVQVGVGIWLLFLHQFYKA